MFRWAGNKQSLLSDLHKHFPDDFQVYHEPYVGAGAVFFNLPTIPAKVLINDINDCLFAFYDTLFNGNKFDVWHMHDTAMQKIHVTFQSSDYQSVYYSNRTHFNNLKETLSPIEKAAYFLYFNSLGHNGIWRENKKGHLNTPVQHTRIFNASIPTISQLMEKRERFLNSHCQLLISNKNWLKEDLADNLSGHFFYIDSPYDKEENSNSLLQYNGVSFKEEEQIIQADKVNTIHKNNGKFVLSNSDTDLIRSLYSAYNIESVGVTRKIANNRLGNYKARELIIFN
ncbi:DNA adenine methylase [Photobacterium leiognathi]|uniref:DNA adenine methylase n=1 Tax=Photobacterium leiognathi TaxID=553611 RepID=UPI002981246C|nr:Dam family site-specific DNA-(adenine-N6)-methyltransferase [Photobacterium leiognathi]